MNNKMIESVILLFKSEQSVSRADIAAPQPLPSKAPDVEVDRRSNNGDAHGPVMI